MSNETTSLCKRASQLLQQAARHVHICTGTHSSSCDIRLDCCTCSGQAAQEDDLPLHQAGRAAVGTFSFQDSTPRTSSAAFRLQAALEDGRVIWAFNDALRLAPLPVLAAANGHTFFVQHLHRR